MYNKTSCLFKYLLLVTLASTLFGCASSGIHSRSGEKINDVFAAFSSGDARLTCGVSCSGAWGSSRKRQKGFYENELWNDLALEVSKIGFASDQSYFYLGRAAEGLGYREAARTYYKLALSRVHKCAGWINNCDGFDFPVEINTRLNTLNSLIAKETSERLAKEATAKSEREASERLAKEATAKSEREASERLAKEATAKSEREASEKLAKEATAKSEREASEGAERTSAKNVRKAAVKSAKTPPKSVKETAVESTSDKGTDNSIPRAAEPQQKQAPAKVRSVMDL